MLRSLAGGEPATPAPPPPPGFEEIQRAELTRLFGRMVKVRLVVLPALFGFIFWLLWGDPSAWRRAVVFVGLPIFLAFFVVEALRFRRAGMGRHAVSLNVGAAVIAQLVLSTATGGIESPVLPFVTLFSVISGLFITGWLAAGLVAIQVAAVWTLTAVTVHGVVPDLVPAIFGGGPRAGHRDAQLLAGAGFLTLYVLLGAGVGRVVRWAFDAMLARALVAQQDALRLHAERTEELTALSGEIAHELKNPLASVKGLAALLAETVAPGKPTERLGVLRREVERMQGILDEFLNFSRPLVPLALGRVDLAAVAAEVAAMHEGMAHERGVEVAVLGDHAIARCDPRKVKQVLVNLVQNGLDASRPGTVLELEVRTEGDRAAVAVHDRGAGLDPALAPRAFDAGVTSKESGFGLGLTIARALARQHGGDVELAARAGGGCSAVLTLPAEPAAAQARGLAR
jgi:signal transduction histidine kinase